MGLPKNASEEDIRKKYRELARKYHPDVNPGDQQAAERFKELSAAFEILNDPQSRREYDAFGTTRGQSPFAQGRPFTSAFEDMFHQFFHEQRRQVKKGENITVHVNVSLKQVFTGDEIDVIFDRRSVCDKCNGVGGKLVTCTHCNGTGSKVIQGRMMTVKASCHSCNGSGNIVDKSCPDCDGGYSKPVEHKIKFSIFPGVENGMRFIQHGLGEPSPTSEGVSGDLYIIVLVDADDFFQRQQDGHILVNWFLTYKELIFGTEIDVPTIEGTTVKVKIPEGTQPGKKFRLKQMGLPIFNPGSNIYHRGDQYINIMLNIPSHFDDNHKDVVHKLHSLEVENLNILRETTIKNIGEKYGKFEKQ